MMIMKYCCHLFWDDNETLISKSPRRIEVEWPVYGFIHFARAHLIYPYVYDTILMNSVIDNLMLEPLCFIIDTFVIIIITIVIVLLFFIVLR